jgi:ABC-type transporter Mla MlaB component
MAKLLAFSYEFSDGCVFLQGKLLQSTLAGAVAKKLLALQPQTVDFSQVTAVDATALALILCWRQQKASPILRAVPPTFWAMARVHGVAELLGSP